MDRPDPFIVTEAGAGTGALAAGLLGGLRDAGSPLLAAIRYRPVEREEARIAALRDRLADRRPGGSPRRRRDRRGDAIETGAVVANEVLDALPVHRVVGRPDGLRERFVGVDGDRFAWVEAEPSTPELAARLEAEGVALADGQVTEVCLAVDGWLAGDDGPPRARPGRARGLRRRARGPPLDRRDRTARCGRSRATRSAATRSATSAART